MHFFAIWGCLRKMFLLKRRILLARGFFWDQSWLAQTPPTGFLDLFLIFQIFVVHICIYLGNWGVEGAMCKILELYDQNPWRNNFPKLATFDHILQRPHSALHRKVKDANAFKILNINTWALLISKKPFPNSNDLDQPCSVGFKINTLFPISIWLLKQPETNRQWTI